MLAGHYPGDEFAELRPRVIWDRAAGTVESRRDARTVAVISGGTIPDRGLFGVYLADEADGATTRSRSSKAGGGRRVGELDEEMVYEAREGEVILLGASAWRIEQITHDRVLVSSILEGRRPGPAGGAGSRVGRADAHLGRRGRQRVARPRGG
jgi:ATP-dependent Lhr-like helicase